MNRYIYPSLLKIKFCLRVISLIKITIQIHSYNNSELEQTSVEPVYAIYYIRFWARDGHSRSMGIDELVNRQFQLLLKCGSLRAATAPLSLYP